MENLLRFFKFLLIPIRVPLGTVALVTYGPLAVGIGTAAITVGTTAYAKFGRSGQQIRDPDIEAIIDVTFGGLKFLAAVANPFDELERIENNNFSLSNNDLVERDTQVQEFIKHYQDMPGSDREVLKKHIEQNQDSIKEELTTNFPGGLESLIDKFNENIPKEKSSEELIQDIEKTITPENRMSFEKRPQPSPKQNISVSGPLNVDISKDPSLLNQDGGSTKNR
ncbi:MAG: hypothetical protein ISQ34_01455 [Rickettsiales bacterium]|nr:hypothetical protein [Rickettsiales bacterium]